MLQFSTRGPCLFYYMIRSRSNLLRRIWSYKGDDFPLSALCVCSPTPHEILDIEYVTVLCILDEGYFSFFFHLPLLEVNAYRKLDEPDILTAIQDLRAAFQVQMRLIVLGYL